MKGKTPEEMLIRRRKTVEIVHECAFCATLALTVLFFWSLGGKSYLWNIILAAFGAILDFNKKSQLELAAVTTGRGERRVRKLVALILAAFTLLSGLGAALNRTLIVTQEEAVAVNTVSIDKEIGEWEKDLAIQQEQQNTATRKEWRDDAYAKAEKAKNELKKLRDKRDSLLQNSVKTEKVSDMFDLLARTLRFKDAGTFMVVLLMLAQAAMELSLWVTTPQYWKEMGGKPSKTESNTEAPETKPEAAKKVVEEPKKVFPEVQKAENTKLAPEITTELPPVATRRVSNTHPIEKPSTFVPDAINPAQKPAIVLRELNESVLKVKTSSEAKKTTKQNEGKFLDLFGGEFF